MTCRDCIGYSFCSIEKTGNTRFYDTECACDDVEIRCGKFKNKADIVEIVRCKDCVFAEKQIDEMVKVMEKSNAITYEPNAYPLDLPFNGRKIKYYVSEHDGHLTIDYRILAKDLYNAGYRDTSFLNKKEGKWQLEECQPGLFGIDQYFIYSAYDQEFGI